MMKLDFLKRLMLVVLLLTCGMTALAQEQNYDGKWNGTLNVQQFSLKMTLTLQQTEKGINATLDIPEQGLHDYQAQASLKGEKLTIGFPDMYAAYTATLRGDTLDGKFTQMGYEFPMIMVRERARVGSDDEDWVNDSLLSVFDNIQLDGIEVTAQRQLIKQEVDRIGYNVEADADSKTNNVLTMLRKVPMVSVDASDEIRVNGQTNFKIFRNGHPDPSLSRNAKDLLKAMPASSVKRIEVITEPGAKYDAEGTTVILNIVMADHSSIKGVSGMASAMVNQYAAGGGSLNLTTQIDKVVTSIDYSFQHDNGHIARSKARSITNSFSRYTDSGAELEANSLMDMDKTTAHVGTMSASWEPDSLNLVSLSLSGYAYDYGVGGMSSTLMRDAAGNRIYSYSMGSNSKNDYYSMDGRLDYQRLTRRKGEAITLSYMLSATRGKSIDNSQYIDMFNMPVPYTGIDQNAKENFNEHTFQLDWTRPLAPKHTLETGVKYIYRMNRSHNVLDYLGTDADTDLRFRHITQVGAAYLSYTFASGPWSARAGLRYEHSYLRASYPNGEQPTFDAHLNDWVPSASVRYQFDWANSLKLSYAASINRPNISYLNPAVVESPTSRSFGNVGLGSVHYHSVSLTYMRVGAKLTFNLTPRFQFSRNGISAVKWTEGLVQVSTYANTLKTYSTSLSAFVQWMAFQKTNLMLNGSIGYDYYKSSELDLKNDRLNGSVFANITQYLPWKLQASAYVGMWCGGISSVYGHSGSINFHGLSLQRSFLKEDRLTVQLMAANPFSNAMTYKSYTTQGDVTGWSSSENRRWSRQFVLTVSYRFGSLKTSVKKTSKTIENDDLIGNSKQNSGGATGAAGAGNTPGGGRGGN